jgi:hypothetical protein
MIMSQNDMNRRDFLKSVGLGTAVVAFSGQQLAEQQADKKDNLWGNYFWYAVLPKVVKAYTISAGKQ